MFSLNESNRFVFCLHGVDLRKDIDGLCGCIHRMFLIPTSGDVYVIVNKNRTAMKLVHWGCGGFVIYYKRETFARYPLFVEPINAVFLVKRKE